MFAPPPEKLLIFKEAYYDTIIFIILSRNKILKVEI